MIFVSFGVKLCSPFPIYKNYIVCDEMKEKKEVELWGVVGCGSRCFKF